MHYWRATLLHTTYLLAQPTYITLRYLLNPDYFSSTSTSWLAFTAISWVCILTQVSIPFFTSPLRHLPSPPNEHFPLCHLDFNGGRPPTDNVQRLLENTPNDGVIVLWFPFYLACQPVVTQPDTFMEVLNVHSYDWEKPPLVKRFLSRTLGDGLINVEGNQHKAMRKVIAPAFSGHHIRDLVPLFYSKGLILADALVRDAAQSNDRSVEVLHHMARVTLDIIGAAGIGADFNEIEQSRDSLADLYATITDPKRGPIWLTLFLNMTTPPWVVRKMRGTTYAKIANAQLELRQRVRGLVQDKKRLMQEKTYDQKDIIAIIMKSGDYPDDYLVDQLLTFLAAGHDTTAVSLTWALYLLAKNPTTQDRLRAECSNRLSKKAPDEVNATDFDPENTPYLTAVCNETLRLYPAAPVTSRRSVRPTKVGNHVIPAGIEVMLPIWSMNRLASFWGSDAQEFLPDRWLEKDQPSPSSETGKTTANATATATINANGGATSPYAFLTFLYGPRSCIGQTFAKMEMKVLLATLVANYSFELVDADEKVEVGGFITIKPKNPLRIRMRELGQ